MGRNAITTIAIGFSCLLGATYYAQTDLSTFMHNALNVVGISQDNVRSVLTFLHIIDNQSSKDAKSDLKLDESAILLTSEQLKEFDGGPDSKGLYLAILGEVFDVEKGAQHYRPGGGYSFFTGRDASRAYITGDFSENGLIDDLSGLEASSLSSIEDWLSFYREEYKPVGKVIGRYYDKNGAATEELLQVKEKIAKTKKNRWVEDQDKEFFPPCNSEWSKEKGSKVWCTKKSGGIDREWIGVPRELHKKGKDPRCVCVKNFGPPSGASADTKSSDRGDLDHPDLKEYPGCLPTSDTCKVNHP
ncbi:neuferricin-like [Uloborus diversus]|uniref:neuferricin-like n=1 Tax=Uloborus diversus TaxID=327109 RepID=UPI0024096D6F|nr:neuferricin-like [Uloborus diversus]